MSLALDEILADADAALAGALDDDQTTHLHSMIRFMRCFERLAQEVSAGTISWHDVRPWGLRNAERLRSARKAMDEWQWGMGELLSHGGEEDRERGLLRRSQHAFAREVFRDTPADEFLDAYEDEETDQEFREEAERLALDAPDYVPSSHTWWRWRDS